MTKHALQKNKPDERRLDETVADSFPASDPPAHSGMTGVRRHHGRHHGRVAQPDVTSRSASYKRGHDEQPTGYPTWDRHATETAHGWEDEEQSSS
jgi:hypothetical protein